MTTHTHEEEKEMTTAYDFEAQDIHGKPVKLSVYRGKPLLIVNTASECGFTPQYKGLQKLHEQYAGKGLVVVGFPCNQFGGQEPGDADAISSFCEINYGVTFPIMSKVDVKGDDAHPLFKWLSEEAPGILGTKAIKWNFTKFLVDKNGKVVERFTPNTEPKDLAGAIEKLL
jgi:glutathione peroxidase